MPGRTPGTSIQWTQMPEKKTSASNAAEWLKTEIIGERTYEPPSSAPTLRTEDSSTAPNYDDDIIITVLRAEYAILFSSALIFSVRGFKSS